jgi:hypothetical protein
LSGWCFCPRRPSDFELSIHFQPPKTLSKTKPLKLRGIKLYICLDEFGHESCRQKPCNRTLPRAFGHDEIMPRAAAAIASGSLDTSAAAVVVLQAAAVAKMASVPMGFRKAKTAALRVMCLALGLSLFSLNLFNAMEVAGHVRKSVTAVDSAAILKAAAINSRTALLQQLPHELPQGAGVQLPHQLPHTTAAMINAARGYAK